MLIRPAPFLFGSGSCEKLKSVAGSFAPMRRNTALKYTKYSCGFVTCLVTKSLTNIRSIYHCEPPQGVVLNCEPPQRINRHVFVCHLERAKRVERSFRSENEKSAVLLMFAMLRGTAIWFDGLLFGEKKYEIFLQFKTESYFSAAV